MCKKIIRQMNESCESFIWRLMIDFKISAKDMKFSYNYEFNGEQCFSKHVSLFELWHCGADERVPSSPYDTRSQFFKHIQHRTVLPCEIMFDIDDNKLGEWMKFDTIKNKSKWVYNKLINVHGYEPVVYFTGSKSYHISVIDMSLREMSPRERRDFRMALLERYGCDRMMAHDGCTIALENSTHYRSGKKKTLEVW